MNRNVFLRITNNNLDLYGQNCFSMKGLQSIVLHLSLPNDPKQNYEDPQICVFLGKEKIIFQKQVNILPKNIKTK